MDGNSWWLAYNLLKHSTQFSKQKQVLECEGTVQRSGFLKVEKKKY